MPDSSRATTPEGEDLDRDGTPVQARKRRPGKTAGTDPRSLKRTRLMEADARERGIGDEGAQHAHKTTLYHPEPIAPGRSASFLRDFAQIHHNPCPFVSDPTKEVRRSVSEIGTRRDADRYAIPPTPASTGSDRRGVHAGPVAPSGSPGTPSGRSSWKSLVEDPHYRKFNLAANNIYMRSSREEFPKHIAGLIERVRRGRDSPGPSLDEIRQDEALEELAMGAVEAQVENYFKEKIFPSCGPRDSLERSDRQPMTKHTAPSSGSKLKVSTPVLDLLYGYNRDGAFPRQQAQVISAKNEVLANGQGLICPFLVIEFKGDGPTGAGSMWVATNQCLGPSASCVSITERLSRRLNNRGGGEVRPIDAAAFSVALRGTEARLFISWKHERDYYMAQVDSFLLQRPHDYLEFRKCVLNILDWGKGERLQQIRDSLDSALESSRRQTPSAAKSRASPSDRPANKRRRPTSSRGSGGGPAQQPGCGPEDE